LSFNLSYFIQGIKYYKLGEYPFIPTFTHQKLFGTLPFPSGHAQSACRKRSSAGGGKRPCLPNHERTWSTTSQEGGIKDITSLPHLSPTAHRNLKYLLAMSMAAGFPYFGPASRKTMVHPKRRTIKVMNCLTNFGSIRTPLLMTIRSIAFFQKMMY